MRTVRRASAAGAVAVLGVLTGLAATHSPGRSSPQPAGQAGLNGSGVDQGRDSFDGGFFSSAGGPVLNGSNGVGAPRVRSGAS